MGKQELCRPCFMRWLNNDPAMKARKMAALTKRWATPGAREYQAMVCRASVKKRDANPESRAKVRANGLKQAAHLMSPEVFAKAHSAEAMVKRVASLIETRLGWCPPEHRDSYRRLRAQRGMTAAEAKRIILDEIATAKRRAEARLSPFERQERALYRGGKLIANDTGPNLAAPGDFGEKKWG